MEIGELQHDELGMFRIINGEKIYQIEEKDERDKILNENINRVRASGLRPSEYLKEISGINWGKHLKKNNPK